jgi:hypothetical protein
MRRFRTFPGLLDPTAEQSTITELRYFRDPAPLPFQIGSVKSLS